MIPSDEAAHFSDNVLTHDTLCSIHQYYEYDLIERRCSSKQLTGHHQFAVQIRTATRQTELSIPVEAEGSL